MAMGGLSFLQEQQQRLNAGQMQSLDILTLSNQELDSFMAGEYLENPLLDCSLDSGDDGAPLSGLTAQRDAHLTSSTYQERDNEDDNPSDEDYSDAGSSKTDQDSLESLVLSQLDTDSYTSHELTLVRLLVCCLDEHGFFPMEPEKVARALGFPLQTVEQLLERLRQLEPAGIFSPNMGECLIYQLERQGICDDTLETMLREHLSDMLDGKLSHIAQDMHLSPEHVRDYLHVIGTLNPYPLAGMGDEPVRYVVPDIVATREGNAWHVELNDRWMGTYGLNDYYLRMMERTPKGELKEYLQKKYKRARLLVDAIERRRNTIVRIAETILDIQEPYFLYHAPLVPMTLEDVAQRVEVHPSTVSRAIRDKYLQYQKTVLVKDLFGAALGYSDVSSDEAHRALAMAVKQEDPAKPLSDSAFARLLQKQGISISRRTVAKYREQLGIPDSRQRGYL